MASGYEALRKAALPASRILAMAAESLGLTGTGGGGTPAGDSMLRKVRCSAFSVWSSAWSAVEGELVWIALLAASMVMGSWVNVSMVDGLEGRVLGVVFGARRAALVGFALGKSAGLESVVRRGVLVYVVLGNCGQLS